MSANLSCSPNSYIQYAPLAYITKLYIELIMARLISKVVRGSNTSGRDDDAYSHSWNKSNPRNRGGHQASRFPSEHNHTKYSGDTKRASGIMNKIHNLGSGKHGTTTTITREGSSGSDIYLATYHRQQNEEQHSASAITKTIETTVQPADSVYGGDDRGSREFADSRAPPAAVVSGRVFDGSPTREPRLQQV
jgi:hypothetical protein